MSSVTDARSRSKGLALVAVLGALAATAWSASQAWVSFTDVDGAALGLRRAVVGRELSSAVAVLPLIGLATTVAVIVGSVLWVRVSALAGIVTSGIAVGYATALVTGKVQASNLARQWGINATADVTWHILPVIVSVLGCVVFMAAGAVAVVRVPSWSGLSKRYQRQSERGRDTREDVDAHLDDSRMWAALDRGEDPTTGRVTELNVDESNAKEPPVSERPL